MQIVADRVQIAIGLQVESGLEFARFDLPEGLRSGKGQHETAQQDTKRQQQGVSVFASNTRQPRIGVSRRFLGGKEGFADHPPVTAGESAT